MARHRLALNLSFLVETPQPVGEGGGIGNAILGTLVLIALASAIGLPLGIAAGIYLAEFGGGRFATVVRFVADTLTGVPSIVVGVFVYTVVVLPMGNFSALAGGVALAIIMMPDRRAHDRRDDPPRPGFSARRRARAGRTAVARDDGRRAPGGGLRHRDGRDARGRARHGRDRAAPVHGPQLPLLQHRLTQPIASLTVQIYNYAISPYEEWHALAWAATLVLMTHDPRHQRRRQLLDEEEILNGGRQ